MKTFLRAPADNVKGGFIFKYYVFGILPTGMITTSCMELAPYPVSSIFKEDCRSMKKSPIPNFYKKNLFGRKKIHDFNQVLIKLFSIKEQTKKKLSTI